MKNYLTNCGIMHEMNKVGLLEFLSTRDGLMQVIEQLCGGAKTRLGYATILDYISTLVKKTGDIYQIYTLPKSLVVHRARLFNFPEDRKKFKRHDLGPPSPEYATTYGRCHQPRKPICYCSLYEDIALTEVRAEKGQHYIISTFELHKDIRLLPIGELDYFRRTERTYLGEGNQKTIELYNGLIKNNHLNPMVIDAFLADEFIKPATFNTDYLITSAFSDILFNDLCKDSPPEVLVYPSVAFRGGLNFAISINAYESKMKLIEHETKLIKVIDVLGYEIYEFEIVDTLKSCSNGILEWA